jgi:hypothetical protein
VGDVVDSGGAYFVALKDWDGGSPEPTVDTPDDWQMINTDTPIIITATAERIATSTPDVDAIDFLPGSICFRRNLNTAEQWTKTGAAADAWTLDVVGDAPDILAALLGVDGAGSGLDADKLDGVDSSGFAAVGHNHDAAYDALGAASSAQSAAQSYAAGIVDDLSGVSDASGARSNLGLGGAATKDIGATAGTVAAGDDSRFSNARTPTAHASSHADGGTDELSLDASQITSGTIDDARIPGGIARDSEVSATVSAHTGASDPHGDRAYAAGLVDDLSGVSDASGARSNLGLGSLATLSSITSSQITDGTITDTDIATANKDGTAGTASLRTLGTGAAQAAAGNHTHSAYVGVTGGGGETVNTQSSASGSVTLNLANGNVFDLTATGNISSLTLSGATNGVACSFSLIIRQDGTGSRTVAWMSGVKWPGGVAPVISTAANRVDIFTGFTVDGGSTVFMFSAGIGCR